MKKLVSFWGRGEKSPQIRKELPVAVKPAYCNDVAYKQSEDMRKISKKKKAPYRTLHKYEDPLRLLGVDMFRICISFFKKEDLISGATVNKRWKVICDDSMSWRPLCERRWKIIPPGTAHCKTYYKTKVLEKRYERYETYQRKVQAQINSLRRIEMVCRMFHPTNGRCNFEKINPVVSKDKMPPRDVVMQMLQMEDMMRLQPDVQKAYRNGDVLADDVTLSVQKQVVSHFGYDDPWIISSALSYYKGDEELMSIPHYVRFNRSQQGQVKCGDLVPDVPLCRLEGNYTNLLGLLAPYGDMPVIVVAGSYT